jgi:hypothetical protein
LTRGIRRSFEPAVVMILIYGNHDLGVKSQNDEVKMGLQITEPSCSGTAACSVNRNHQCLFGLVLGRILPARDLCIEPACTPSSPGVQQAATATRGLSGIAFA